MDILSIGVIRFIYIFKNVFLVVVCRRIIVRGEVGRFISFV